MSQEQDVTRHDVLDQTLPPELQNIVTFAAASGQPATELREKQEMSQPTAPTAAEIQATARQITEQVLAERDSRQAIATQIEKLTTDRVSAESRAVKAEAAITERDGQIAQLNKDLQTAKAEATQINEKLTKAEADKAAAAKELETVKAELATANKKLSDITAERVVASRTAALKEVGEKVATEVRVKRATARKQDGSFEMTDDQFNAWCEDLKDVAKASASATPQTPAAPAAPAQPAAQANQQTPAAPAAPAAPAMATPDAVAQATAALLNGSAAPANPQGVKLMASMFGA